MDLLTYKTLHAFSALLLLFSLGGLVLRALEADPEAKTSARKLGVVTHGIALLLLLVTGFGALAKLGIMANLPGWVWAKIVIWLFFGAIVTLIHRKPALLKPLWILLPVLAGVSAWLALYKPF
ncbi:MAG: hypothetical protein MPN21_12980 [Thermoanaerobaculia bacterium]|nr:hypothetical protein [Thermoanaerobaculia bacterium]